MAIISNVTLTIQKSTTTPTNVKVTIKYRLTPSRVEQMAGSVFNEEFSLLARDWLSLPVDAPVGGENTLTIPSRDNTIIRLRGTAFPVSDSTPYVERSRSFMLTKRSLNEDPELSASGSEIQDEVLARANVTYAANQPTGTVTPYPGYSSLLVGTWV
jgi:hypothetical protein